MQGNFKVVSSVFQGGLKNVSMVFHGCLMDVSRMFKVISQLLKRKVVSGKFRKFSTVLPGCLIVYQLSFMGVSKCFQKVSRVVQESFVLLFCCCMAVIAATGTEGGLVYCLLCKIINVSNFST